MRLLICLVLGVASFGWAGRIPEAKDGAEVDDTFLEPTAIIRKYGYPAENHTIQTDDGYILTLHRIPYGKKCATASKGPVLLQHGLLTSSVDWFISGTEKGLAYILADDCYDVWLANSRGNAYSTAHVSLPIDGEEYWDFSWHEMGQYDTPAEVDYILFKTGWNDTLYVGHGQGTSQFFVFSTQLPEYSEKIRAAFLLGPVAFLTHNKNQVIDTINRYQGLPGWVSNTIGSHQFNPTSRFTSNNGGDECKKLQLNLTELCENIAFIVAGFDSEQLNETLIPITLGHLPAGAATKQFLHYAQILDSGEFRQYDYGRSKNNEIYGQPEPPNYDLSKITIPTFLHYSRNDLMAAVEDVVIIRERMSLDALEELILISSDKFNHFDYIVATDVVPLVYDKLLSLMNRFY